MPYAPKFKQFQYVIKLSGTKFGGKIVGEPYLTEGPTGKVWHYNVCATHYLFKGTVHIMVEHQIREATELEALEYGASGPY